MCRSEGQAGQFVERTSGLQSAMEGRMRSALKGSSACNWPARPMLRAFALAEGRPKSRLRHPHLWLAAARSTRVTAVCLQACHPAGESEYLKFSLTTTYGFN
jgi:hypothetical protein